MKLEVPYYSQFKNVSNKDIQNKACTVTCLKMALDFINPNRAPSIDCLFEEANLHGLSMKEKGLITEASLSHGFPHDIIILMSHNYGVPAYREEFKSMTINNDVISPSQYVNEMFDFGIQKLKSSIENKIIPIVSVFPGLSDGKSFHTIILVGFEDEEGGLSGFYYHDPDSAKGDKNGVFISISEFKKFWRKMAMFVG